MELLCDATAVTGWSYRGGGYKAVNNATGVIATGLMNCDPTLGKVGKRNITTGGIDPFPLTLPSGTYTVTVTIEFFFQRSRFDLSCNATVTIP